MNIEISWSHAETEDRPASVAMNWYWKMVKEQETDHKRPAVLQKTCKAWA